MADRSGLKLVGFIFATVTLAVMLATGMVVKGYADGAYSFEGAVSQPISSAFANHSGANRAQRFQAKLGTGSRAGRRVKITLQ